MGLFLSLEWSLFSPLHLSIFVKCFKQVLVTSLIARSFLSKISQRKTYHLYVESCKNRNHGNRD